MQDATPEDILDRLGQGYSLPSLSVVAMKIIELAARDDTSFKEIADLIEKDPALTVRLLRLANSAYMRLGDPVTTIEQAILRLGAQRVRIMALSLSLRDTFPMGRSGWMDYEEFWRASLYRGLMAKSLAYKLRTCNPDEAFVAGLTQEIGLLVFFDLFLKGREEEMLIALYPMENLIESERAHYGIDHRQVGEIALGFWNFPAEIVSCQKRFAPEEFGSERSPLCRTCDAADELSALLSHKAAELNVTLSLIEGKYGLDHEVVSDIMITTFEEVEEIADALNVELNKEKDLLAIMEKANEALARISEKMTAPREGGPLPSFGSLGSATESKAVSFTMQAVAHEIRNPLTAVGGFVKRLFASLDPATRSWEYAKIILEETHKLELALSQIERDGTGRPRLQ